jgi:predicted phage terminase large subunit-like protein
VIQAPTDEQVAAIARGEMCRRELLRRRLMPFTQAMGPPDYSAGWFHYELTNAIEEFERAIVAQEAPRLMIFAPPRHGKSEIVSKSAPSWLLGRHPRWEGIVASYGDELTSDVGSWMKQTMSETKYRCIFPNTIPRTDREATKRLDMTSGGSLRFVSINGAIVGRGMHFGVIDDPIKNRAEASSEAYRKRLRDWYTGPFLSRLSPGGGVLLMHQRWDQLDLAGWLLDQPGHRWKVLNFPAIAEQNEKNRKVGEALHPERWSLAELLRKRSEMSSQDWLSMYQQRPTNPEGSFFKVRMINWMDRKFMPRMTRFYQAWDLALSPKQDADESCGACMAVDHLGRHWLVDMVHGRWSPEQTAREIIKFWQKYRAQMVWFENGPPYLGVMPSLKAEMRRQGVWVPNDEVSHGGQSKDYRAVPLRGVINGGNLYACADSPWRRRFEEQAAAFPNGKADDMIDPPAYLCIKGQFMKENENLAPLPKQLPAVERSMVAKQNIRRAVEQRRRGGEDEPEW